MNFRLRQIRDGSEFSDEMKMDGLSRIVPREVIQNVLSSEGVQEQRRRKLPYVLTVWVVIGMNLYTDRAIQMVLKALAQGLRLIWPDWTYATANASAISQRRAQLGARVMMQLFHKVCQPLATPQTQGAFLFGRRLMAMDGTLDDVPDTSLNVRVFGKHRGKQGDSAFPKVRSVLLTECGTHAVVDATFWPVHISERVGAARLVRAITPDMLVMLDRGLYGFGLFQAVLARQSQVLARVPAHVQFERLQTLPDSSYLATIRPTDYARRKHEYLVVRVIEYVFTDPGQPGFGELHRLVTTLLDPVASPALDLVCGFHQRWEVELTFDELQTHQRLNPRPLRSLTPRGIIQELYGLLIAHYIIRAFMHEAAVRANLDPDRISFVGALRLIQQAIPEFQLAHPAIHAPLLDRLLRDIADHRLPPRRCRIHPRVVKRHVLRYIIKRPEHRLWPQPTLDFHHCVRLI